LGLPNTPNLQFLKLVAADREQRRESKNVNKKLQRLKEQIKAEKLAKKLQAMPPTVTARATPSRSVDDNDDDDELLVPKQRTTPHNTADDSDEEELPDFDVNKVTMGKRQKTKIRTEVGHGQNKKIVFDEDGNEVAEGSVFHLTNALGGEQVVDAQRLADDSAAYLATVRSRLERNREQDEADHKERIRQKHKKRRLEDKADREEDGPQPGEAMVVLGRPEENHDDRSIPSASGASSSSSSSSSDDSSSVSTSNDDDDDPSVSNGAADVRAQEDLALAMIRKASNRSSSS
jgi:ATP-dependent RNA helicase DDX10/DBP4